MAGLGFAAALLAATTPSLAQDAAAPAPPQPPAQGQAPGQNAADPGWVKFCSENPETKERVCVVTRERRAASGQLLAAFSIRETGEKRQIVTAVPPGMQLRPGLQVQIDGAKAMKVTYTICFPNLCFGDGDVDGEYVTALKRGNTLVISALGQQGKAVSFPISLVGFTASYDGEAIDPKQLQENNARLQDELNRKAEEARQKLIQLQQKQ